MTEHLEVGDEVEVHTRYDDSWGAGFRVLELVPSGYRLQRTHDGTVLPAATGPADVRRARGRPERAER